jgi:hypothetical protein
MSFAHYLITRFSVPYSNYIKDKKGEKVRTAEWLEHRFKLFETYCLPSVIGQSSQNFTWLVFFDLYTPNIFKQRIESIGLNYPNFKPIYINSSETFIIELNKYIAIQTKQCEYLITSRVDNDDAIHQEYIQTIQNSLKPDNDFLLNFRWGLQLDIKTGLLYQNRDESNPFLSRICRYYPETIKTVFEFGHREACNFLPIKQILNLKGWLIIVHEKNMLNTIGGKPLLGKINILKHYNILNFGKTDNLLFILKAYIIYFYKAVKVKYFSQ